MTIMSFKRYCQYHETLEAEKAEAPEEPADHEEGAEDV